jgi:high-affinity nickel-transport protein
MNGMGLSERQEPRRAQLAGWLCGVLVAANIAAWGCAWLAFAGHPVLLGSALLAYTFGLRHAVDADHIAAIDNATRKLIEAGQDGRTTGLYFSLGHATVVVLGSIGIALASARLETSFAGLKPLAGTLSTGFSAACLFALAAANGVILVSVCRLITGLTRRTRPIEEELAGLLARRGLLGRLLRGVFRLISKSWHMYPLGLLFGLGFDTATEIGVLGVSASQAANGLPLAAVMVFPALFTAGMALVDSLDAILMDGAYRWAAVEPLRKLWYNLTITLISIVAAVAIGGIELVGVLTDATATGDDFWPAIASLNDHLAAAGAMVIALCAAAWFVSAVIWRVKRVAVRSG